MCLNASDGGWITDGGWIMDGGWIKRRWLVQAKVACKPMVAVQADGAMDLRRRI
jgi:hypothetical protein